MTQTHEALKLADEPSDFSSFTIQETKRAQILLRRQHLLILHMVSALETAYDHIEFDKLRISHLNDANRISEAVTAAKDYLK